jgi:DNA polymerase-3 subunit epsilon
MKILIFDTETGGLDAYNSDILQLSYQIMDYGTQRTIKSVDKFFPWPEDKSRVSPGAIQVNGLTEEYLSTKELSDRYEALDEFYDDMEDCELVVAHNGDFDKRFIIATAEREGLYRSESWKPMIDTMKTTTNLCCLPPHPGRTGYKWPKLIELAEFLNVPTDDINLHDSSADVELTKRCFVCLLEKKYYRL